MVSDNDTLQSINDYYGLVGRLETMPVVRVADVFENAAENHPRTSTKSRTQ